MTMVTELSAARSRLKRSIRGTLLISHSPVRECCATFSLRRQHQDQVNTLTMNKSCRTSARRVALAPFLPTLRSLRR